MSKRLRLLIFALFFSFVHFAASSSNAMSNARDVGDAVKWHIVPHHRSFWNFSEGLLVCVEIASDQIRLSFYPIEPSSGQNPHTLAYDSSFECISREK